MSEGTIKPLFSWRSAICDSDLKPPERHVALTLSLHMNERGGSAFPGPTLLAKETGMHVATVKEKLAILERKGWLRCVSRGGIKGERKCANQYEATIPDPQLLVAEKPPTRRQGHPVPTTTRRRDRVDPSPSPRAPVAVGDPSTSMSTSMSTTRPSVELVLDDAPRASVADIFDFWQSETKRPRTVLDAKRRRRIEWARANYSDNDIADAIRGMTQSQFHQGRNENGTVYNDIELVLRDAKHLEGFRDSYRNGPVQQIPKAWGALSRLVDEGLL